MIAFLPRVVLRDGKRRLGGGATHRTEEDESAGEEGDERAGEAIEDACAQFGTGDVPRSDEVADPTANGQEVGLEGEEEGELQTGKR